MSTEVMVGITSELVIMMAQCTFLFCPPPGGVGGSKTVQVVYEELNLHQLFSPWTVLIRRKK